MILKITKICLTILLISFIAIMGRWFFVQAEIRNRPVDVTDLAASGYTPQDVFGHGNVVLNGGKLGWYIYDIPLEDGRVRKICANGVLPEPYVDFDFFHYEGKWFKLRTGSLILEENGIRVEPPTSKWKGILSSKTAFPVRDPDFLYKVKIIISKLQYGSLSPLEYLQGLKQSNPSCMNIPAP
ncbi:MAG: hypothetical protein ABJG88_06585 [Litorimonas sp.]